MHTVAGGKVFEDTFGRLYFDTCLTAEEHLIKPVPEGQERRWCRIYVEDFFRPFLGQVGIFDVTVETRVEEAIEITANTVEVGISIPKDEIVEELNIVSGILGDRQLGLEDFDRQRKNTAQILAIGTLFFHLSKVEHVRHIFTKITRALASSMNAVAKEDANE